jgi:hypothetical protein
MQDVHPCVQLLKVSNRHLNGLNVPFNRLDSRRSLGSRHATRKTVRPVRLNPLQRIEQGYFLSKSKSLSIPFNAAYKGEFSSITRRS